jgi:5-methylthioadenosine/S-adenosylhomocysteine deaminase
VGSLLLRGGLVAGPDLQRPPVRSDVLVVDGRIVRIDAPGHPLPEDAVVHDVSGCLLLPGFVDTHRHLWQSVLRGTAADWSLPEYFARMRGEHGPRFTADDIYAATYLGAVEALSTGVTTILDWSHNLGSPEAADAAVSALDDSGIRAVLAYGVSNEQAVHKDATPHTEDVRRLQARLGSSPLPRLSLAMAVRGPEFSEMPAVEHDWELARELGLPMTVHVGGGRNGSAGTLRRLSEAGLLGEDTTYVHCNMLGDDELDLIAASGGRASVSPEVEANMGHGPAATGRLLARGVPTGLSVDVCTNVGGDLFAVMRATLALERGRQHERVLAGTAEPSGLLTTATVLHLATAGGAEVLGLGDDIGTLEVGRCADVVALRLTDLNLFPAASPLASAVTAAHPGNVELVLVDGEAVVQGGRLPADTVARARELALASQRRLLPG